LGGQFPDPGEFFGNQGPDQLTAILNRVDLIGCQSSSGFDEVDPLPEEAQDG
jgi:hypothetical protein